MTLDLAFVTHLNQFLAEHPASIKRFVSTVEHNRNVGGAPNSGHLYGKAVDLIFDSLEEFQAAAQYALALDFHGIEADVTNHHLHLDDMPRIWRVVHRGPGNESPLDQYLTANV